MLNKIWLLFLTWGWGKYNSQLNIYTSEFPEINTKSQGRGTSYPDFIGGAQILLSQPQITQTRPNHSGHAQDGSQDDRGACGATWILFTYNVTAKCRLATQDGRPGRAFLSTLCSGYGWQTSCTGSFTWEVISELPASCMRSLNLPVRATNGEKNPVYTAN